MAHWAVRLKGEHVDIAEVQRLATALHSKVECGFENSFWLSGDALEGLPDVGEVQQAAATLVKQLNGLAALTHPNHKAVETNSAMHRVQDDGRRETYLLVDAGQYRIRGHAVTVSVTDATGKVVSFSTDSQLEEAKNIASQNQLLKIVEILAGDPTWQKLRLAYEGLAHFAGGEHSLKVKAKIDKDELDRFKANCHDRRLSGNEALHFKWDHPVSNKMSEIDGRKFLAGALRALL